MNITYAVSNRWLLGVTLLCATFAALASLLIVWWFGCVVAAGINELPLLVIAGVYVLLVGAATLLAGILLLLNAVSHAGGGIEIGEKGLTFSSYFSTSFFSWNEIALYQGYNGYCNRRWHSFWDFSAVAFVNLTNGKQKLLWPYLFPVFLQIMNEIEREMTARLFPSMVQTLNTGITFGEIKVARSELLFGRHCIPHNEINEIVLNDDSFAISYTQDAMACSAAVSLKQVPNIGILCELLRDLGVDVSCPDGVKLRSFQGAENLGENKLNSSTQQGKCGAEVSAPKFRDARRRPIFPDRQAP